MIQSSLPLTVTLDVGPAVHQRAGLSRYTQQLAAHLLAHYQEEVALTLFYNAHSDRLLPAALQSAPCATLPLSQYAWRLSVLASQCSRLPFYEERLPASQLYHAPEHLLPFLRRPTILTVHDLIFERYPHHHTWPNRLFLKVGMRLFVRAADAIIAVSQQTKRDLIELYQTPAAKIQVIYQGIDPSFAPPSPTAVQRVMETYTLRHQDGSLRPYLLMVGTLEPRKNHLTAMRALARLKQAGFPHCLVIAGGEGWLFEPIKAQVMALGLSADVHFTGYVPAADLPALYGGAVAVLQPTLYEGFGFPVLEAMACGAPVVCSNVSSLPEAAGDAALLVPPLDDEAIAAAIIHLLTNPDVAVSLRQLGSLRAAAFQWQRCASETVALYRQVQQMSTNLAKTSG
ncbi:MAG: glycosyltransferase family 4 protein [Caldilineaceae bacterium]|nr:glycosyltransferase family 4 protein [Caldilineaceae bacterium]